LEQVVWKDNISGKVPLPSLQAGKFGYLQSGSWSRVILPDEAVQFGTDQLLLGGGPRTWREAMTERTDVPRGGLLTIIQQNN